MDLVQTGGETSHPTLNCFVALPSQTSNTVQVRIESLVRFHTNLARALGLSGIGGGQLNDIFSTRLHAECSQCGIKVSGEEIELVAVTAEEARLPHPKLERLRLGYCARESCFYQIQLDDWPGVDWKTVADKASNLLIADKNAAEKEKQRQARRQRNRRLKRIALGVLAIGLLIVLRFLMQYGRLPFVKNPPKYQIDPASVTREP
jgi:hypothetical protein